MQVALYDHKVDNYECCPLNSLQDPTRVPVS